MQIHTCTKMWLDPSCFMSAPGTLSLFISLVLTVSWIKLICLHTATCLTTLLMRLLTLGFPPSTFFVCMCFDVMLIIPREDRYLYLNAGLDKKQR